eukprot:TRINITY_DN10941_c0_g1_i2.p1 TRINITY_DN10941_c0_g1~~TRINITY_DN10941_c0_g1_i2.p1  ORF type:complete len:325 (-),score=42.59 TRINITY_DN10941_c0_g1_i2:809-1783(-)
MKPHKAPSSTSTRTTKPFPSSLVLPRSERSLDDAAYHSDLRFSTAHPSSTQTFPSLRPLLWGEHTLRRLNVSRCGLTSLPEGIERLTRLESLHAYGNRLTSLPQEIGKLTHLQHLHVFANRIMSLPSTLSNCISLRELTLGTRYGGNPICCWSVSLACMQSLSWLALENTGITALPASAASWPCYRLDPDLRKFPLVASESQCEDHGKYKNDKLGITQSKSQDGMGLSVQVKETQTDSLPQQKGLTIPEEFFCPITMAILQDPVVAADGFTYERTEIQRWIKYNRVSSPLTNKPLPSKVLHPNKALKQLISAFFEANPEARTIQ